MCRSLRRFAEPAVVGFDEGFGHVMSYLRLRNESSKLLVFLVALSSAVVHYITPLID